MIIIVIIIIIIIIIIMNLPRQWQTDPYGVTLFLQSQRQLND